MTFRTHRQPLPTVHASTGRAAVTARAVLDRLFPQGARSAALAVPLEHRFAAPHGTRAMTLQPQSWNADARTIEVVWTTGARCAGFLPEYGMVEEDLLTGAANVRLIGSIAARRCLTRTINST